MGDTCYKRALGPANRPPLRNNGVFYGFANYSVFLCGIPSEHVPGTEPSPSSSSKRDSSWQAAVRDGEEHPDWDENTTAFPRVLTAVAADSCFSL